MATKKQKTGAAVAAVIGVGALGLGAVALMRSSNNTNKEADSMFSGMLGGGATGGYSDTTGIPSNGGGSTSNGGGSNIGETIGGVLSEVLQTTPQTQPTPIIINPTADNRYEDIIPLINEDENPADERADIKQGEYNTELMRYAFQNYSGNQLISALDSIGFTTTPTVRGQSNAASALMASLNTTKDTQSNAPVEYSPFNFAPTSKQQDISSYNVGKTGGATANSPAKNTNTGKTSDNRSQSAGAQALTSSLSNGTAKTGKQTMQVTSPVSTALNAAGQALSAGVSAVGSFFSGLLGGK